MSTLNERQWVKQQYRTSTNLSARVALHRRFSTNPESWFSWVYDRLKITPDDRVLEVGGGHGLLWQSNIARLPASTKIVVTDLSPGMVGQAAESLRQQHNFHFAQADAQQLPFASGCFDIVIANHMLYHVPNRAQALGEIYRVLRPGGRLLAATNDHDHMQELRDLARLAEEKWPDVTTIVPDQRQFPFDTALDEIGRYFGQVQLHRFANDLVVTESKALADYLLSALSSPLPATDEAAMRRWLDQRLSAEEPLTIRSSTGLIEANDAV